MSMTQDQAHKLRVLIQEAFELVLARPIAFVLVAQDEERGLEIVTNAERRDLLPDLLISGGRDRAHATRHDHRNVRSPGHW
jgi:hypothetical protein